jgi:hypothetical protein
VGDVGGGFPLRSNIPRSALCATLDTYNLLILPTSENGSPEYVLP